MSTDLPRSAPTSSRLSPPPLTNTTGLSPTKKNQPRTISFGYQPSRTNQAEGISGGGLRFASSSGVQPNLSNNASLSRIGLSPNDMGGNSSSFLPANTLAPKNTELPILQQQRGPSNEMSRSVTEDRGSRKAQLTEESFLLGANRATHSDPASSVSSPPLGTNSKLLSKTLPINIGKTHRKIVSVGSSSIGSITQQPRTTNTTVNATTVPTNGKINSKVKCTIVLNKPFYTAGSELTGQLEISCLVKEQISFSEIRLELVGYEEVETAVLQQQPTMPTSGAANNGNFNGLANSINYPSSSKIFYRTRLLLQDRDHPCPAVVSQVGTSDSEGYWPALKGKTTLPFLLQLAPTLPNAIITPQGRVSYHLEAVLQLKTGIFKENLSFGRGVTLLERWEDNEVTAYRSRGVRGETRKRLFMGGSKHLELEGELVASLVAAGSLAYVRLNIRNYTTKKVQGVRLTLLRSVNVIGVRPSSGDISTETMSEKILRDSDVKVSPGEGRQCMVAMEIPSSCLSLRHTVILGVSYTLQVALVSSFSKDLAVDLPIYISHPSSWSDPCPPLNPSLPEGLDPRPTDSFKEKEEKEDGLNSPVDSYSPGLGALQARASISEELLSPPRPNINKNPVRSAENLTSIEVTPSSPPLSVKGSIKDPSESPPQPQRPSFFRGHSAARAPSIASSESNFVTVKGRRYQLVEPEDDSRPHSVATPEEPYQKRSTQPHAGIPLRHSSYLGSKSQINDTVSPYKQNNEGAESDMESADSPKERNNRGTFGNFGLSEPTNFGESYTFVEQNEENQLQHKPIAIMRRGGGQEEDQYQWTVPGNSQLALHTPEEDLPRRQPPPFLIKRKVSKRVRTRKSLTPSVRPKPTLTSEASSQKSQKIIDQNIEKAEIKELVKEANEGAENKESVKEADEGTENKPLVEAQLAQLQMQMALLLQSLQNSGGGATPASLSTILSLTSNDKQESSTRPVSPPVPVSPPSPPKLSPPLPPKQERKKVHQKKEPSSRGQASSPFKSIHHHRSVLNQFQKNDDDSDWI